MKWKPFIFVAIYSVSSLSAQIKRVERKSLLDSDPSVVYLEQTLKKPIELKIIEDTAIYSDKDGKSRLGIIRGNQTVKLEAITEKSYRVRGQGTTHGIAGWVAPSSFSSSDPDFIANLKKLYERQIQVQALIATQKVAVGMTLDEVELSLGKPTKTTVRKTADGQSTLWEFVEFKEVKHYTTEVDRATGQVYRRLASVSREEKSRTNVELQNDVVTAVEESESLEGGNVKVIVPPLVFRW
ncbi:MAG: hypothetical protein HC845_06610 [Akkermansiaceae bacterium]|nr:hypothetical protein [Akkermansiaceae bacterium]